MIDVDKIEDMRRRVRQGQPVAQIARELHISEPTVRKYRDMEDLSMQPKPRQDQQFPALEGFRETIDAWLIADTRQWRKQRHTATRVYVRLRDEEHYEGSYSTVQRYVRWKREQMALERDRRVCVWRVTAPRTRGDDPSPNVNRMYDLACSPHARG